MKILTKNDPLVIKKLHISFDLLNKSLLVTVYFNYTGDNTGMLLNPQKFRSSMPSIFGPGECLMVLKLIINSCINCAFQSTLVIKEIIDIYSIPEEDEKDSYIPIKCIVKRFFLENFLI